MLHLRNLPPPLTHVDWPTVECYTWEVALSYLVCSRSRGSQEKTVDRAHRLPECTPNLLHTSFLGQRKLVPVPWSWDFFETQKVSLAFCGSEHGFTCVRPWAPSAALSSEHRCFYVWYFLLSPGFQISPSALTLCLGFWLKLLGWDL